MKTGESYRVKKTPFLKQYGLDTFGALHKSDCKAWPGEVGIVVAVETGVPSHIEFARGRRVRIPAIHTDDADGYWANKIIEFMADFVRVTPKPVALLKRVKKLLPSLTPAHYPGKDGRDTEAQESELRALIGLLASLP